MVDYKGTNEPSDIPAPKDIQTADTTTTSGHDVKNAHEFTKENSNGAASSSSNMEEPLAPKRPWYVSLKKSFFTAGSATQIVVAALIAIAIGLIVTTQVDDVPEPAIVIIGIPGDLWLRALQAVVLPLIVCAMIIAVQRLMALEDGTGGKLGRWTVGYYVGTTLIAIVMSCIMVALVWYPQFTVVSEDSLDLSESEQEAADERAETADENPPHMVVKTMFQSFITNNFIRSMAENELLAVLIASMVIGYLIPSSDSYLLKIVVEIESMIMRIIAWLIKIAPIGVFFLILPNLMKLPLNEIGANLGMLIGGTLATMFIHLFITLPILFFAFTRKNPYAFWVKVSPAWVTAWGSASSAATLPVTLRCAAERKIPVTVYKFTAPLGCLINMDGTAIYFPMAVVFLASTQGQTLKPTDYVIICLLATLASIGTTPIPSASLVLIVMIANSVNVEVTGMYAVIVAIDWFLDRFRTAINVSGDLFAAEVIHCVTKIEDAPGVVDEDMLRQREGHDVSHRV